MGRLKKQRTDGFTIVELLIVIVIIGILAALVIIAYRGFKERAHDSQTISALDDYIKATRAYVADNGKYPEPSPDGVAFSCIGTGYPDNACLAKLSTTCNGVAAIASATWYNDAIKTYTNNKTPPVSLQKISCNGNYVMGAGFLSNYPTGQASIFYVLNNNSNCGSPSGIKGQPYSEADSEAGLCYLALPKP